MSCIAASSRFWFERDQGESEMLGLAWHIQHQTACHLQSQCIALLPEVHALQRKWFKIEVFEFCKAHDTQRAPQHVT